MAGIPVLCTMHEAEMDAKFKIQTIDNEGFMRNVALLDSAIDILKAALSKAEPLAISDAAYRVIQPYEAMRKQASLIIEDGTE